MYSYAITSNVFSFFHSCGVAGAHACERPSEGVFFFFLVPARQFSSSAVPARARGPLDPGLNAGVSVRPPAQTGSDTSYTRSRVHTPGEIATPTSTHHISNRIATRFRIASHAPRHRAPSPRQNGRAFRRPHQIAFDGRAHSTNRSLTTSMSNRIRLPRVQYKQLANDGHIKSHSTAARAGRSTIRSPRVPAAWAARAARASARALNSAKSAAARYRGGRAPRLRGT